MFCLRSWIPILFFLTNASPIYLILFISATYVLNRPCVYCSLLLAVLVISLFDFNSNWFEPHYAHPSTLLTPEIQGTIGLAQQIIRDAATSVQHAITGKAAESASSGAWEWLGRLLRKEWRIDCLDVGIRL